MTYMYRSGPEQNIKKFYPRVPDKQHQKRANNKIIYVTNDISFAAGFCFNWSDNEGFKFGQINNGKWTLKIPKQYKCRVDNKCSIYVFDDINFISLKLRTPEYYYEKVIEPIDEYQYSTCWECLQKHQINIKVI